MFLKKIFSIAFPNQRLNRSLRVLLVTNSVLVFILGLFMPFYAVFIQKIGGNIAFAGLSWGLFLIVSGVLTFWFSDMQIHIKEPELILALSYFLRGVVFASYAFMSNWQQLVITQILWGVSAAMGNPVFDGTYAKHTSRENSISQWGSWEGFASIASGLAALVGGVLIQSFGFVSIFFVMSVISFLLGFYIWRLPREVL